jgi:ABC-type multidrug transport system permease subunit
LTVGLWMVVQGYFVQKKNLPAFWRYSFHLIDFQKYGFEGLVRNEFLGKTFQCDRVQNGCFCVVPSSAPSSCTFSGQDVLKFMDYEDINDGLWIGIMIAIFFVFKLGTYLVLKWRGTKQ